MLTPGLKTTISLHLAALLIAAMLLMDFIIVTYTQRYLQEAEIQKAKTIIKGLSFSLSVPSLEHIREEMLKDYLNEFKNDGTISCVLATDLNGNAIMMQNDESCNEIGNLTAFLRNSKDAGKQQIKYLGTTAGVFWRQSRYLALAVPIGKHPYLTGVVIVKSLESIYLRLRKMNKVVLIYICVNTVLFTIIGLSRLSRSTIRPLRRLVKLSEEYRDDHEIFSLAGRQTNEFRALSTSLSQMLKRISEDKRKLQDVIDRLEEKNKELKKAQKKIIRAEKLASVGRLSAGIAHEIGNPIGIMLGYLGLLKQENLTQEDRVDFLSRTENEINRINTIIRQLLDFSRSSPEKFSIISIHELIDEIEEVVKVQPLMTNIYLSIEKKAANDRVIADVELLRQVFLNLLINAADAVKSCREKGAGKIRLSTDMVFIRGIEDISEKKMLRVSIIDNGPGIPESDIENIFDPFYTTKSPGKGTGLGLSVSYMIVERVGGGLSVESTVGSETKFYIDLPLSENDNETAYD